MKEYTCTRKIQRVICQKSRVFLYRLHFVHTLALPVGNWGYDVIQCNKFVDAPALRINLQQLSSNYNVGVSEDWRTLAISLAVFVQYRIVTDRQTDRHLSTAQREHCRTKTLYFNYYHHDDQLTTHIATVVASLTRWRPLLPYWYSYRASCARRVKQSFIIVDIRAVWRSKITNDGLTRLAQDALKLYSYMATVSVKGLVIVEDFLQATVFDGAMDGEILMSC